MPDCFNTGLPAASFSAVHAGAPPPVEPHFQPVGEATDARAGGSALHDAHDKLVKIIAIVIDFFARIMSHPLTEFLVNRVSGSQRQCGNCDGGVTGGAGGENT